MNIEQHLYDTVTQLALKKRSLRRQALINLLDAQHVSYQHHVDCIEGFFPQNIIVPAKKQKRRIVIGAHYDNVPRSCGANDNASGVAILLKLLRQPLSLDVRDSLEFIFFDLEEGQCFGSRSYVNYSDVSEIALMINVDTCGYGDTVLVSSSEHKIVPLLHEVASNLGFVRVVNILPPSDDVSFMAVDVPTVSLCVVPNEDVPLMTEIAPLLLDWQRPKQLPTMFQTIHNRPLDKLDTVSGHSMERAYKFVVQFLDIWKGFLDVN